MEVRLSTEQQRRTEHSEGPLTGTLEDDRSRNTTHSPPPGKCFLPASMCARVCACVSVGTGAGIVGWNKHQVHPVVVTAVCVCVCGVQSRRLLAALLITTDVQMDPW